MPSIAPSVLPTITPTIAPTIIPTTIPTNGPTSNPTRIPTINPTRIPTLTPTSNPSITPTKLPSISPSIRPTQSPTLQTDTGRPTNTPTTTPTQQPSTTPTNNPSTSPSITPTSIPTSMPTLSPTNVPTVQPTNSPATNNPTSNPTSSPIKTEYPTNYPSNSPTTKGSITESPTISPSNSPIKTTTPTNYPTESPIYSTNAPSNSPTETPTKLTTITPTITPSASPAIFPTNIDMTQFPTRLPSILNDTDPPITDNSLNVSDANHFNLSLLLLVITAILITCFISFIILIICLFRNQLGLPKHKNADALGRHIKKNHIGSSNDSMQNEGILKTETMVQGNVAIQNSSMVYQEHMIKQVSYFLDKNQTPTGTPKKSILITNEGILTPGKSPLRIHDQSGSFIKVVDGNKVTGHGSMTKSSDCHDIYIHPDSNNGTKDDSNNNNDNDIKNDNGITPTAHVNDSDSESSKIELKFTKSDTKKSKNHIDAEDLQIIANPAAEVIVHARVETPNDSSNLISSDDTDNDSDNDSESSSLSIETPVVKDKQKDLNIVTPKKKIINNNNQ
eukprot:CAMPEP_0114666934 /NCGR_PEP_ID=MMETSP0191-20121206/33486_1 /TAXON_ID=126664 /ORGANISM="Sorites sp." /LENGTH=561 /DNA_ID=CAMNT_0001915937 /DNA_START=327 /DNA_END=2012 /DNA_ORIENTATION=+